MDDDVVENAIGGVEADLGAPVRRAQVDLPAAEASGVVTAEVWLPPGWYARFALEPEADEVRPVRIDDAQGVHAHGELRREALLVQVPDEKRRALGLEEIGALRSVLDDNVRPADYVAVGVCHLPVHDRLAAGPEALRCHCGSPRLRPGRLLG